MSLTIKFFRTFQILLSADIITLYVIKNKGIAQIFNISADCYMISCCLIRCQQLTDLVWRSKVADVIHEEFAQSLQDQRIRQRIFPYRRSHHNTGSIPEN